MNPFAGGSFQLTHEVRQWMNWFHTDQQVDMVLHSTDFQRLRIKLSYDAAKVFVQSSDPLAFDPRRAMLGRKRNMEIDAVECGHRSNSGVG